MGPLERYVSILRLFNEQRPELTIPAIAAALDRPASTIYRIVRDMVNADFLEASTDARYRLGACFVEFDRLVRITDPVCSIGTSLLPDVVAQAGVPCLGVLTRLYGDTVMSVVSSESSPGTIQSSYERGRPRPLTRGATSKVILAQLPSRRLSKLLKQHDELVLEPGAAWEQGLRDELTKIRKRGYCITRGEVDPGVIGIAAPVSVLDQGLIGSLSIIVQRDALQDVAVEHRLVLLAVSSASLMTTAVRSRSADIANALQQ